MVKKKERNNVERIKFEKDILKVLYKYKYISKKDLDKLSLITIKIIALGVPKVDFKYKEVRNSSHA